MMMCPRGCAFYLEYIGIDDGFGENQNLICDVYRCPACGEEVAGNCMNGDVTNFDDVDLNEEEQ